MARPLSAVHGSRSRYATGCRCPECREANTAYLTAYRRARGVLPLAVRFPPSPHGSIGRYQRHECRCQVCKDGDAARARQLRARQREPRPCTPLEDLTEALR